MCDIHQEISMQKENPKIHVTPILIYGVITSKRFGVDKDVFIKLANEIWDDIIDLDESEALMQFSKTMIIAINNQISYIDTYEEKIGEK